MVSTQSQPKLSLFTATILMATVSMSLIIVALFYLINVPSLGIRLSVNEQGQASIAAVSYKSNIAPGLQGSVIKAIKTADGRLLDIGSEELTPEPNQLARDKYPLFLQQQQLIYQAMQSSKVTLVLANDKAVIAETQSRPIGTIPLSFWFINFFGTAVLLIAFLVYRIQPRQISTRILLAGATGLFISAITVALYSSRELALPANTFFWLKAINVLGVMTFSYSMVALFAYYPKRVSKLPLAAIIYCSMFILWLLETIQLAGIQTGFYKYFVNYLVSIALALYQWNLTSESPVDRAALKWLMISIIATIGLTLALYYLPILFHGKPIINLASAYAMIFILFVGFTLGISRYRLFNMERWWLEFWIWLASASVIIFIDALLIANLELNSAATLTISLLVIGWLYFPLREWLLSKTLKINQYSLDAYMPLLIETLFDEEQSYQPHEQYTLLLHKIFNPLEIRLSQQHIETAEIQDNGMSMLIPDLELDQSIRLYARNRGTSLFTPYDLRLQESLRLLARNALTVRQAYDRGVMEERQRIKRDLHDDVAVKLIEVIHNVDDENASKARKALNAVRQAFQVLENNSRYTLALALHHIISDVKQSFSNQTPRLHVEIAKDIPELTLSPRHMVNIKRIIEENISNIIKHAKADNIYVDICWKNNQLMLAIKNDGQLSDPQSWPVRKGLHTIKTRSMEIGGKFEWYLDKDLCHFELTIPLEMEGSVT